MGVRSYEYYFEYNSRHGNSSFEYFFGDEQVECDIFMPMRIRRISSQLLAIQKITLLPAYACSARF